MWATLEGPMTDCDDGVAIPAGLFKIIFGPNGNRINAYILPNEDHLSKAEYGSSTEDYLNRWRVTVANVENHAGYGFLPILDRHGRNNLEQECPATMIR